MKEKLSAFVDGELSEHEQKQLLRELTTNPELSRMWERFHVIRAAVKHELDMTVSPKTADHIFEKVQNSSDSISPVSGGITYRRPIVRAISGLAIAASVAGLAIFGIQTFTIDNRNNTIQTASTQQHDYIRTNVIRWDTSEPEQEDVLNAFLVEHNEFTPTSGMSGMMSYVRVIGYDSEK